MTDNDRNMRTLVVCFVVMVLSLVSLRLVEFGQNVSNVSSSQVLGETIQEQEVILPNAEIEIDLSN